jgi:mannose-6-phosphate isomerase-like protein (cupin superfamily)
MIISRQTMHRKIPKNLSSLAQNLPEAWRSLTTAHIGNANLKILRMDACAHAEEVHAHDEAFLVLEGSLHLSIDGESSMLRRHEFCVIPAGVVHGVLPGSSGCLMIMDAAGPAIHPPD